MKALVIFNTYAAAGRSARLRPAIQQRMHELGIAPEFLETAAPGHATELVADCDMQRFDVLVAAGGDGTLFEVVNGVYERPPEGRIALGVLPIGTGNAFAQDLGLRPGDWRSGIQLLTEGTPRRIDVGRVRCLDETYYFLNIIGMGFAVDAGLTALRLKALGRSAYTLATLREILRLKTYPIIMDVDGQRFEEENLFVEISNTRYTGTHFLIAPRAIMNDGLFDLTVVRPLSRLRLLRLFPTIYSGRHIEFDEVITLRGRKISIDAPSGMPLAVDGEFRGSSPVQIECLHQDLEFIY